jgi:hypothetical protein
VAARGRVSGGRPDFIGKRALARGSRASPHGGPRHGQGGGEARRPIAAQGRRGARTAATSLAGGAGRFRAACERAARGKGELGANVGAEALGPAVATVLWQSCPVSRRRGLAWPHARRRAWVRTRGAGIS